MHNRSLRSRSLGRRRHGTAAATLVASLAMLGGTFTLTAAAGASASADPTTMTTATSVPVTVVPASVGPRSLSNIKARSARAIANRVASLTAAIKTAEADSFLGSDATTLVNQMQADISGLQSLGNKIAGDGTVAEALSDYRQIFTQYRVYYLVLPVASLVTRTDRIDNVNLPAEQKEVTTLQGELTTTSPKQAAKLLSDAQNELTKATTATSGLSASLLSYTAAQWDANHNLLSTPRGGVSSAHWDLAVARWDVARAERDLRH